MVVEANLKPALPPKLKPLALGAALLSAVATLGKMDAAVVAGDPKSGFEALEEAPKSPPSAGAAVVVAGAPNKEVEEAGAVVVLAPKRELEEAGAVVVGVPKRLAAGLLVEPKSEATGVVVAAEVAEEVAKRPGVEVATGAKAEVVAVKGEEVEAVVAVPKREDAVLVEEPKREVEGALEAAVEAGAPKRPLVWLAGTVVVGVAVPKRVVLPVAKGDAVVEEVVVVGATAAFGEEVGSLRVAETEVSLGLGAPKSGKLPAPSFFPALPSPSCQHSSLIQCGRSIPEEASQATRCRGGRGRSRFRDRGQFGEGQSCRTCQEVDEPHLEPGLR